MVLWKILLLIKQKIGIVQNVPYYAHMNAAYIFNLFYVA